MAAGFLFKSESLTYPQALFFLGCAVVVISFVSFAVRFSEADEKVAYEEESMDRSGELIPSAVIVNQNV